MGAVMLDQLRLRPDNPCAPEAVAERERNRFGDERVRAELRDRRERDVSGRNVDVIDAAQDELQRAPLGADHEIDALRVARHAFGELLREQHRQRDNAETECEQQHDQRRRERPPSSVRDREASNHAAASVGAAFS